MDREQRASDPTTADPQRQRQGEGWLAGPLIAIVAVVCCAGPLLLVVIAASGAGAWLASNGYAIRAAALLVIAAALAWRIRARLRRR